QGKIAGGKMPVEIWYKGTHLDTCRSIERARIDARASHDNHAQLRQPRMDQRPTLENAPDQVRANARAADRHDADAFIGAIAQSVPKFGATAERARMLADDVAREVEMLRDPVAHRRQIPPERHRDNIGGRADKDRTIAHSRMVLDMPDHLGVIVRGQEGLVLS